MIQITQTGVVTMSGAVGRLRAELSQTGCAVLPDFLAPSIVCSLLRQLESGQFESTQEAFSSTGRVFGRTLKLPQTEPAVMTLHFILNTPALFTAVEGIAGCKNLRNYLGRIHRTTAGTDQEIDWHDDAVDYRTIGLGINLTTQPYSGGRFMIRDPRKQVRRQIGQLPAGDAFLFLLGPDWQHRLTPVESGTRTVAFGWFRTQPDWRAVALSGMRSEPVEPKTGVRQ